MVFIPSSCAALPTPSVRHRTAPGTSDYSSRMDSLSAAAALISLAALFSWLNHKYIRQPQSIALLLFSLTLSLALVALGKLGFDSKQLGQQAIESIELD